MLRRSLGVSEKAQADTTVEPAPPVSPPEPSKAKEAPVETPHVVIPDHLKDKVSIELEEYTDDEELPPRERDEL